MSPGPPKGDSPCSFWGFGDRLCRAEAQAGPCVCSTLCAVSCLSGLVRVLLKQNMRLATRIRKHNCFALTHTRCQFCTNTHTSLWNCAFVTGPSANVLCGESAQAASGEHVDVDTAQAPRVTSSSGHAKDTARRIQSTRGAVSVAAAFSNNDAERC